MKIWIETELHSNDLSYYDIAMEEHLNLTTFIETENVNVKMSEEYYSHTIEYNFYPEKYTKKLINNVKNYLQTQIEKYDLKLNFSNPAFVWTHIHFFDKTFIEEINKNALLKRVLSFIIDHLDGLEKHSLYRLILAHQLWGNYSFNHSHRWKEKLKEYWLSPTYYDICRNKRKYNPIIFSPGRRNGKAQSIEIRIVPNEYIFNGNLNKMLKEIKSWDIYNRKPKTLEDLIDVVAKKLNYEPLSTTFEGIGDERDWNTTTTRNEDIESFKNQISNLSTIELNWITIQWMVFILINSDNLSPLNKFDKQKYIAIVKELNNRGDIISRDTEILYYKFEREIENPYFDLSDGKLFLFIMVSWIKFKDVNEKIVKSYINNMQSFNVDKFIIQYLSILKELRRRNIEIIQTELLVERVINNVFSPFQIIS